jgi:NitT/TauT family transport system permease protein
MNLLTSRRLEKGAVVGLSVASFVLVWYGGSLIVPQLVPGPQRVLPLTAEILDEPGPRGYTGLYHLQASLVRVFIIVAISMVVSVFVGTLMGVSKPIEEATSLWLPLWMAVPDVVLILLVMIVFGFGDVSVIVGVTFLSTPFGIVNMWQGMKDLDADLTEMADAFDANRRHVWRYIYIPHLVPYIFASGRYLLGQIWKIVLVAEAFGISTGMGAIIRFWYQQGELAVIFAYLVLFIGVVFAIEYLLIAPLQYRWFRWRPE